MSKPRKMMICGYEWKIIYKDTYNSQGVWGETHPDSYKIYLDKTLKGEALERVLLHEVIHAILAMSGIGSHDEVLKPEVEEQICLVLEHQLHLIYSRRIENDN